VATPICMPLLSMSMSEGKILEWLVADGAQVSAGQPLYTVESEKTIVEIEAPASGVLRLGVAAGESVAVGTQVAEIA